MKKFLAFLTALVLCVSVCGCGSSSDYNYNTPTDSDDDDGYAYAATGGNNSYDNSSSYFSNDYGTSTTKCAKSGCSNYIASSGDTAYCVSHSNKCLECYCYIDGDAMYCMDCLTAAANGNSSSNGSFSNDYGSSTTKCAKSGCNNYITSSGDSAYCSAHSNKCLQCGCYIDGDAMYCMDCLSAAISGNSSSSSSSSSHKCYICGDSAYSKYGSFYYCSSCLDLVKAFS